MQKSLNVAVAGAGLVGTLLAKKKKKIGHHVQVFDKNEDITINCDYNHFSKGLLYNPDLIQRYYEKTKEITKNMLKYLQISNIFII